MTIPKAVRDEVMREYFAEIGSRGKDAKKAAAQRRWKSKRAQSKAMTELIRKRWDKVRREKESTKKVLTD